MAAHIKKGDRRYDCQNAAVLRAGVATKMIQLVMASASASATASRLRRFVSARVCDVIQVRMSGDTVSMPIASPNHHAHHAALAPERATTPPSTSDVTPIL